MVTKDGESLALSCLWVVVSSWKGYCLGGMGEEGEMGAAQAR